MFFYFNDKSGFRGGSAVLFQICSDPALFKFFKTPLEFRQSKDIQRKSAQHRAADCHTAVRDPDDRLDRLDLFDQFAVLQFRNLLELRFLVSLLERLKVQDNRACLHILPDLYCDPYRIDFGRDLDRRSFDDHAFCGDQAAFFRNFFHMDIIQPDVVPAGKIDPGKAPIFFHETAAGILHFSVTLHVEIHSAAAGNEFHILPLPVTRSGRERGNIFVYSNGADRNLCRRPERGAVGIVQVDHDRFPDFRIFRGKGEIQLKLVGFRPVELNFEGHFEVGRAVPDSQRRFEKGGIPAILRIKIQCFQTGGRFTDTHAFIEVRHMVPVTVKILKKHRAGIGLVSTEPHGKRTQQQCCHRFLFHTVSLIGSGYLSTLY